MIEQNDLYDIAYALTLIRNDIANPVNREILQKLIGVLEKQASSEDNQVRKALAAVEGIDAQKWYFVYHNNVYTAHHPLTNPNICRLLADLCTDIVRALENGELERAYDLTDACHMLPLIIANKRPSALRAFFRNGLSPYRRKWDRHYRLTEQRTYRQYF